MSLRRRLLLTLAPLFIAGLVAVGITTYLSLQSFLVSQVDQEVFAVHGSVEGVLLGRGGGGDFGGGPGGGGPELSGSVPPGCFGEIVSANGAVLTARPFTGPGAEDANAKPVLPSSLQPKTYLSVASSNGGSGYRVYVDDESSVGAGDLLVVALPLSGTAATLSQLLVLELIAGGGITVVILIATWLVVRRGLRPLERMGDTARVAATDLSQRVQPATDATEVGRLGLAINAMLGQLEVAFAERAANEQRLRHFVSDASHELRTPLTSIGGYAELLRRNPAMTEQDVLLATRRIEEESRRMGVLVDDLLLLARLDQGRPLDMSAVDLGALIADASADARAADPARVITARIDEPVQVTGDDMRLRQVLGNLVRNALVHTAPGTPIEVALRRDGPGAVIEVIDHGPGIAREHAHRIFERFHRSDPGRSRDQGGSGLGLSIAAAVVAAHGGSIRVEDTAGGGATFRIDLPALPIASPPPLDGGASASTGPADA